MQLQLTLHVATENVQKLSFEDGGKIETKTHRGMLLLHSMLCSTQVLSLWTEHPWLIWPPRPRDKPLNLCPNIRDPGCPSAFGAQKKPRGLVSGRERSWEKPGNEGEGGENWGSRQPNFVHRGPIYQCKRTGKVPGRRMQPLQNSPRRHSADHADLQSHATPVLWLVWLPAEKKQKSCSSHMRSDHVQKLEGFLLTSKELIQFRAHSTMTSWVRSSWHQNA